MIAAPLIITGIILTIVFGIIAGVTLDEHPYSKRRVVHTYAAIAFTGIALIIIALFYGSFNEGWFA